MSNPIASVQLAPHSTLLSLSLVPQNISGRGTPDCIKITTVDGLVMEADTLGASAYDYRPGRASHHLC